MLKNDFRREKSVTRVRAAENFFDKKTIGVMPPLCASAPESLVTSAIKRDRPSPRDSRGENAAQTCMFEKDENSAHTGAPA